MTPPDVGEHMSSQDSSRPEKTCLVGMGRGCGVVGGMCGGAATLESPQAYM